MAKKGGGGGGGPSGDPWDPSSLKQSPISLRFEGGKEDGGDDGGREDELAGVEHTPVQSLVDSPDSKTPSPHTETLGDTPSSEGDMSIPEVVQGTSALALAVRSTEVPPRRASDTTWVLPRRPIGAVSQRRASDLTALSGASITSSFRPRLVDINAPIKFSRSLADTAHRESTGQTSTTYEEAISWSHSFEKLMASETGRAIFHEFLRNEYSEENLLFWTACEQFKRATLDSVRVSALGIYEDFISILSPREISIDSRIREGIERDLSSPSLDMYTAAQMHVYVLMSRDSYPRFTKSLFFANYLKKFPEHT